MIEEIVTKSPDNSSLTSRVQSFLQGGGNAKPQPLPQVESGQESRIMLGGGCDGDCREGNELDRVLGGGMVKGSLVLIGGEPGIGKSTLSLQIPLFNEGLRTLYVSGEESAAQIKMRAQRLDLLKVTQLLNSHILI